MTETRTGYCKNCDMKNPNSEGTEMATEFDGKWLCNVCNEEVQILPEELKDCPFCGEEGYVCNTNPHAYWIRCEGCSADAESADNINEAVQNWNRRA